MATGVLVERLRGHRDSVYSVAFTPDGKGLISGSLDKTLKSWDVTGLSVVNANGPGGNNAIGEKGGPSTCTMDFVGHKVPRISFLHVRASVS